MTRPDRLRNMRHIDANRVVEQTILNSGISDDLAEQIDYSALEPAWCAERASVLREVIASLNAMLRALECQAVGTPPATCLWETVLPVTVGCAVLLWYVQDEGAPGLIRGSCGHRADSLAGTAR